MKWERVAVDRVMEVENLTGIPRHILRPDIYPPDGKSADANALRFRRFLLRTLFTLLLRLPQLCGATGCSCAPSQQAPAIFRARPSPSTNWPATGGRAGNPSVSGPVPVAMCGTALGSSPTAEEVKSHGARDRLDPSTNASIIAVVKIIFGRYFWYKQFHHCSSILIGVITHTCPRRTPEHFH